MNDNWEIIYFLRDLSANIRHVADSLQELCEIKASGGCDDCTKKDCRYRPNSGKLVRYNCPHFKGKGERR